MSNRTRKNDAKNAAAGKHIWRSALVGKFQQNLVWTCKTCGSQVRGELNLGPPDEKCSYWRTYMPVQGVSFDCHETQAKQVMES